MQAEFLNHTNFCGLIPSPHVTSGRASQLLQPTTELVKDIDAPIHHPSISILISNKLHSSGIVHPPFATG